MIFLLFSARTVQTVQVQIHRPGPLSAVGMGGSPEGPPPALPPKVGRRASTPSGIGHTPSGIGHTPSPPASGRPVPASPSTSHVPLVHTACHTPPPSPTDCHAPPSPTSTTSHAPSPPTGTISHALTKPCGAELPMIRKAIL